MPGDFTNKDEVGAGKRSGVLHTDEFGAGVLRKDGSHCIGWGGYLGKWQGIAGYDTQYVNEVAVFERHAIGVDIAGGNLCLQKSGGLGSNAGKSVQEVVGERHGIRDFIGKTVEIEVATVSQLSQCSGSRRSLRKS